MIWFAFVSLLCQLIILFEYYSQCIIFYCLSPYWFFCLIFSFSFWSFGLISLILITSFIFILFSLWLLLFSFFSFYLVWFASLLCLPPLSVGFPLGLIHFFDCFFVGYVVSYFLLVVYVIHMIKILSVSSSLIIISITNMISEFASILIELLDASTIEFSKIWKCVYFI